MAMSKYGNRKTTVDGITFDSKKEAERYCELNLMEKAGKIKSLRLQERFCLIPTIEGKGRKVVQRAVYYIADFTYYEKQGDNWKWIVEDVKSPATKTAVYKLKKKLLRWQHGFDIREV